MMTSTQNNGIATDDIVGVGLVYRSKTCFIKIQARASTGLVIIGQELNNG